MGHKLPPLQQDQPRPGHVANDPIKTNCFHHFQPGRLLKWQTWLSLEAELGIPNPIKLVFTPHWFSSTTAI